jgi:hypothetical protein
VALKKELKYNYAKLTRTQLITIDNDAKSCFDCILCNIAMLVSQYFGIATKYCRLQSTARKETNFRIRIALGDSKRSNKHNQETLICGTGQGSCASPALWLLICSILMDLLQENGNGITMEYVEENTKERLQQ